MGPPRCRASSRCSIGAVLLRLSAAAASFDSIKPSSARTAWPARFHLLCGAWQLHRALQSFWMIWISLKACPPPAHRYMRINPALVARRQSHVQLNALGPARSACFCYDTCNDARAVLFWSRHVTLSAEAGSETFSCGQQEPQSVAHHAGSKPPLCGVPGGHFLW